MGREVRRVPANWQHPKRADGRYEPLLGESYTTAAAEWDEGAALWAQGLRRDWDDPARTAPLVEDERTLAYAEYEGERPVESDHMPDWPEVERTHWQMYETTSEGTPISPAMESPEVLARWLVDNNASAFAGITATYDQWLATIRRGWACSAMSVGGGSLVSGVEGMDG